MSVDKKTGPAATGPRIECVKKSRYSRLEKYTTGTGLDTRTNARSSHLLDLERNEAFGTLAATDKLAELYKNILHWEGVLLATVLASQLPVLDYLPEDLRFFGSAHRALAKVIRDIDHTGVKADLITVFQSAGNSHVVNAVFLSGIHKTGGLLAAPGYIRDFCTALVLAQDLYDEAQTVIRKLEEVLEWGVYDAYGP